MPTTSHTAATQSTPATAIPANATTDTPAWFNDALAHPPVSCYADVNGARIHYLALGMEDTQKPVLLFLHGFRAHAHWWDFIAPFFRAQYRVLAMDFSGMGDSEHRASYSVDTFAADITGLIDTLGIGPVTGIGHSYGGSRLLRACAERPELFKQAIVIDSYVLFDGEAGPSLPAKLLGTRAYSDFESACARYRLMPEQPDALPFLVSHIAGHALREAPDGWRWKFDTDMPTTGYRETDGDALLARITTPVDFIRGECSEVVSEERAERTVRLLQRARGPVVIPKGQHHLMLDQPLALVSALRALLAQTAPTPPVAQSAASPRKSQ